MRRILLLSCLMMMAGGHALASVLPDFPFVTVEGSATQEVKPDQVILSFEITTFSESAGDANKQLIDTTTAVLGLMAELGIKADAITSYEINKQTKRRRDEDYNFLDIIGYEFSRDMNVALTDLETYKKLVDKLMKTEFVHSIASEFNTSKRKGIEIDLIAKAAAAAREKADVMAKGLGVSIDSVFAFNDSGSFQSFFSTFGLRGEEGGAMMMREKMVVSGTRVNDIFMPQSIEITKKVNVIYKLK